MTELVNFYWEWGMQQIPLLYNELLKRPFKTWSVHCLWKVFPIGSDSYLICF